MARTLEAQGADTVRIRVVDSEGAPVPQAVVALWQEGREQASGLTSGSGRVGLLDPGNDYLVDAAIFRGIEFRNP